jgi:carbamoyl-phosphate synthase large subunit
MNILFTCAGRRNYLLHYFKNSPNFNGKIIAADMQYSAPAMVVADIPIIVPPVYANGYIDRILEICKEQEVALIISLNDLELPILASNRKSFDKLGVQLLVSSEDVIDTCFDKWKTAAWATSLGLQVPKTYLTIEHAVKAIEEGKIKFPLVVKPRWGSASIGIEFPESTEELELAYRLLKFRLSRSMLAEISKTDFNHAIIIQEKIIGKEYGLDILNDLAGNPVQVFVKEKLAMRAGETDKSILRNIPELENIGLKIGQNLNHIGNLDCDIFEKDGVYYLLEMNPRFGGGYPFSHMAGANYPEAIINWIVNTPFNFSNVIKTYDQAFSKCDTLIKVRLESV